MIEYRPLRERLIVNLGMQLEREDQASRLVRSFVCVIEGKSRSLHELINGLNG